MITLEETPGMFRAGFVFICIIFLGCHSKKTGNDDKEFSYEQFSDQFSKASLPYQLSDTALLHNKDTASIHYTDFSSFIPDSLKKKVFGKSGRVKYFPLRKIDFKDGSFYIVKGTANNKKATFLLSFDKKQELGAVMPYLIPDDDPTTSQNTIIDKSFSISANISQKKPNEALAEGKNVYEYDAKTKKFILIMTDPLNDLNQEIVNPIDTLSRKQKHTGDYAIDKKNFISVRDGRYPNQLMFFIHMESGDNDCTGEFKGEMLVTSSTTAIYRQGGDPCVMSFSFSPNSVTIKEDEGCGSHRGLNCSFNGRFSLKKEQKSKKIRKKT